MIYKVCNKCGLSKALTEFHKATKCPDGYRPECKTCHNLYKKEVTRRKKYAEYGITHEEYEELYEFQGGLCKICGNEETRIHHQTGTKILLAIDHDHVTGKVRGLLCANCNLALGYVKDDIMTLENMIKYLRENG